MRISRTARPHLLHANAYGTYPGTLRLNGWWFDVASGSMYAYDRTRRAFELIDREGAERLFPGSLG